MKYQNEMREQDYKDAKIRVAVQGFPNAWSWKVDVTYPNGELDAHMASPSEEGLPNTKEAAFVKGFSFGEKLVDKRFSS